MPTATPLAPTAGDVVVSDASSRRRGGWRVLAISLAIALASTLMSIDPAAAATSTEELERELVAMVNVERAKHGLGALAVRSDIVTVARAHARTMATQQRLHHNPDFSRQITGWQRVSENVGVGPNLDSIHKAFLASPGHRANILDDRVTEVGIGIVTANGRIWITQNYRRPSSNVQTLPASMKTFGDVASTNVHAASIATVSSKGIIPGCSGARFCPTANVTRGQFATMLVKALKLPAAPGTTFTDTAGHPDGPAIEALAAAGLTNGCGADRFCPDTRLTREQLATFFARALDARPSPSPFKDVSATHDGSVGTLYRLGITTGCGPTTYCPRDQVTRAQTASMIARNLA